MVEGGLEVRPTFQEGFARVGAVGDALVLANRALLTVETSLAKDALSLDQHRQLSQLAEQGAGVEKQLLALPASEKDVEVRRQQVLDRLEADDKEAFKLDYEIQSMQAALAAVQKWVRDTKPQRSDGRPDAAEFLELVKAEESEIAALRKQLQQLRQSLADSKGLADAAVSGGSEIRNGYRRLMQKEQALLTEAELRLSGEAAALVERAHQIRSQTNELEQRVAEARRVMREQVASRGKEIRDKVAHEQSLVNVYQTEVGAASANAQNLVGRIAINSFRKGRRQFYELVHKADIGLIDVTFGRKQGKTQEIQKLAVHKDQGL